MRKLIKVKAKRFFDLMVEAVATFVHIVYLNIRKPILAAAGVI